MGSALPFVALIIAAIFFSTRLDYDDSYMVLTIIFSILSAVSFFIAVLAFYKFETANKKVKLNEMDTSTKVGREFLACREELENLNKIYSSIQNDIS